MPVYDTNLSLSGNGHAVPILPLSIFFQHILEMRLEVPFVLCRVREVRMESGRERTSEAGSHWSLGRSLCRTLWWDAVLILNARS